MSEIENLLCRLPSPEELNRLLAYLKPPEKEQLLKALSSRIDDRFCPHEPTPKQRLFLSIDDREAMFGGAAGGGKSDGLLMAFLQYVDIPGYRGLILRRKSVDLYRADAILNRAKAWWLRPGSGVRWRASERTFIFPSGATCEFGHMNNEDDKLMYQGSAYHFIAYDELTQFTASQYLYLFSRLRRVKGEENMPPIPLRMRSATNPGGPSHYFFRNRFMSLAYARSFLDSTAEPIYTREIRRSIEGTTKVDYRHFVPSKVRDNEHLDTLEYASSLAELDPVTRGQLLEGDWLVSSSGRFKPEWFQRFRHPDLYETEHFQLMSENEVIKVFHPSECIKVIIVDPAGTEADFRSAERGEDHSHSVISEFMYAPDGKILWTYCDRFQLEFPEVCDRITRTYHERKPDHIFTETDGIGRQVYQTLERRNVPIEGISSEGKDKLARSSAASTEAKEGRVWLPESAPWLDELEAELFVWQGLKSETSDQIDTLSYAGIIKRNGLATPESFGGSIVFGGR